MKDLKISTELASAVLGKEVTKCSLINKSRNSINITYFEDKEDFNTICREWNIYELDFICREWAYIKGFIVEIGVHPIIKQDRSDRDYFYAIKTLNGELLKKSNVDEVMKSEPQAIIKACNWVLENILIKNK